VTVGLQLLMKARKVGRGPAGFVAAQGMPEQRLFQPGLIPINTNVPNDTIDARQQEEASNAARSYSTMFGI